MNQTKNTSNLNKRAQKNGIVFEKLTRLIAKRKKQLVNTQKWKKAHEHTDWRIWSVICSLLIVVQWFFGKRGYETFAEHRLGQYSSELMVSLFAFALFLGFIVLTTATSHVLAKTREPHKRYVLSSDNVEKVEAYEKKRKKSFYLFIVLFIIVLSLSYYVITIRSDFSQFVKTIELSQELQQPPDIYTHDPSTGINNDATSSIDTLLNKMGKGIVFIFFTFVIFEIFCGLYFLKFLELSIIGMKDLFTRFRISRLYSTLSSEDAIIYQIYVQQTGFKLVKTSDMSSSNLTTTTQACILRGANNNVGDMENYLCLHSDQPVSPVPKSNHVRNRVLRHDSLLFMP